jgi:hypothetical protein
MAAANSPSLALPVMRTSWSGTLTSTRAALSTEVIAREIVPAQRPHVMSGIRKVTIVFPLLADDPKIDLPIMERSSGFSRRAGFLQASKYRPSRVTSRGNRNLCLEVLSASPWGTIPEK